LVFDSITDLPEASGDADLALREPDAAVALAWRLRQVSPARVRALLQALPSTGLPAALRCRLRLIEAEWAFLNGGLDAANTELERLWDEPAVTACPALQADVWLLRRSLCTARGEPKAAQAAMAQALSIAQAAGDQGRTDFAAAVMGMLEAMQAAAQGDAECKPTLDRLSAHPEDGAGAVALLALASLEYNQGQLGQAAVTLVQAWDALRRTGQTVSAVVCAGNLSATYLDLADQDAALDWAQRGLELARTVGFAWPLGMALMRTAERLRTLGQSDAAIGLLNEAQQVWEPFRGGRNFALLLIEVGATALEQGDTAAARRNYELTQELATRCEAPDLVATALLGLARTALAEGDLD
jgi:tetratricopeptide (TPR) repeat protein